MAFLLAGEATIARASETPPPDPDALTLSGKFRGVEAGPRALARGELLKIPGVVELNESPSRPVKSGRLTVLPLDAFLARWPVAADADALVLMCSDRWESLVPLNLIRENRPYLLLLYEGKTPAQGWPVFSKLEGLAPYFCNVSPSLAPPLSGLPEHGEIDATQIVEIRAVNTNARYAPFFEGKLRELSGAAQAGRRTFLQLCNTCHQGPGGVGGNVSQRPFSLLQLHATMNVEYFQKFVRNPKQFLPQTLMPVHANFTDETMASLIAFLSETKSAGVN